MHKKNSTKSTSVTRVLLADDHRMFGQLLTSLLNNRKDIDVVGEARTGNQVVEIAMELKPDIVLMDISFPEIDGVTATKQMLKQCPEIKIIVLTMHSGPMFFQKMMEVGAAGFLTKDCGTEELIRAIQTVKKGTSYISPGLTSVLIDSYVSKDKGPKSRRLTDREREVLQCIADGSSTQKTAQFLEVSPKTVETHRRQIMRKLGIDNIAMLTKFAIREGLSSL
jgi:DNA-binding NarL/FixJ family response regulator